MILDDEKIYDITVVGGGPTGLFATFYAFMLVCETLPLKLLIAYRK